MEPHGVSTPIEPRRDKFNRRLCTAHRSKTGEPCMAPAMRGQNVCRAHGGAASAAKRAAKLRLAALVEPAIATLAREMADRSNTSRDKQTAANSLLDRAGWGRVTKIEAADARELLFQRLLEIQADNDGRDAGVADAPSDPLDDDDDEQGDQQ